MFKNFIGGRWCVPAQHHYLLISSSSGGKYIYGVPRSFAEDVERAIDEAHQAREEWCCLEPRARVVRLAHIPDQLSDKLWMVLADCWDQGISSFTVGQHAVETVLESLREPLYPLSAELESGDKSASTTDYSVVMKLAFTADTPFETMCQRIIPLLLQGHVLVVVLLYRNTNCLPVRLLALMGLMASCLPAGVLNLITGLGLEAGVALVNNARVMPLPMHTTRAPEATNVPSMYSDDVKNFPHALTH